MVGSLEPMGFTHDIPRGKDTTFMECPLFGAYRLRCWCVFVHRPHGRRWRCCVAAARAPGDLGVAGRQACALHGGDGSVLRGASHRAPARRARSDVRLMSPEYVRSYVRAQKNDDRDAQAIAEAATRATMRFVDLKSEDQLDLQTLHRARSRVVGVRQTEPARVCRSVSVSLMMLLFRQRSSLRGRPPLFPPGRRNRWRGAGPSCDASRPASGFPTRPDRRTSRVRGT